MLNLIRRVCSSGHFFDVVLVLLIIAALGMGAEATPSIAATYGERIATLLTVLQVAFVLEITLRVLAYSPRPQDYFRGFWNNFDFIVVALSLLPAIGSLGLVSRLFRLTRLVRIVPVAGALRNFSRGRTHGIAAVISAVLMLGLLWYVMALAGFYLFAAVGAGHWTSMANGLTSVGQLLIIQRISQLFAGVGSVAAHGYLAVLYLAQLAIFIEMISHLLRSAGTARDSAA